MTINHKKISFARVSIDDQNLDLQRNALTKASCTEIYEEKASGTRPLFAQETRW